MLVWRRYPSPSGNRPNPAGGGSWLVAARRAVTHLITACVSLHTYVSTHRSNYQGFRGTLLTACRYLSLTWATVILLSGHAANLQLWDFWVVTVILTVGAARAFLVESTSKLTKLWQAGCTNSREGHILPLRGEGNQARRVLGTIKCLVMLLSCILSLASIVKLGGAHSKRPPTTLIPALYVFYATVLGEAWVLLMTMCHR